MSSSETEVQFSIGTIMHPSFLGLLDQHLSSLSRAQAAYPLQVRIVLLLSFISSPLQAKKAQAIIDKYSDLDTVLVTVNERLTCGAARNIIQTRMNTPWKVFLDVDVAVSPTYFQILKSHLVHLGETQANTKAVGGGIGCFGETPIGLYECLMDLYSYYGKARAEHIDRERFNFKALVARQHHENAAISAYSGAYLTYLQGFNHILHEDVFKLGGYDEAFFGAEDREMAGKIIAAGYDIVLIPECLVYHYYHFTTLDILRRKYGHGYYSAMFRRKYASLGKYPTGLRMWTLYSLSLLKPPKTFQSPLGYLYYFLAYCGFTAGTLMFYLQSRMEGRRIFRFNYSAYTFTRRFGR